MEHVARAAAIEAGIHSVAVLGHWARHSVEMAPILTTPGPGEIPVMRALPRAVAWGARFGRSAAGRTAIRAAAAPLFGPQAAAAMIAFEILTYESNPDDFRERDLGSPEWLQWRLDTAAEHKSVPDPRDVEDFKALLPPPGEPQVLTEDNLPKLSGTPVVPIDSTYTHVHFAPRERSQPQVSSDLPSPSSDSARLTYSMVEESLMGKVTAPWPTTASGERLSLSPPVLGSAGNRVPQNDPERLTYSMVEESLTGHRPEDPPPEHFTLRPPTLIAGSSSGFSPLRPSFAGFRSPQTSPFAFEPRAQFALPPQGSRLSLGDYTLRPPQLPRPTILFDDIPLRPMVVPHLQLVEPTMSFRPSFRENLHLGELTLTPPSLIQGLV